mmetsp:Transcript_52460/g.170368  ORF Transcript_52460/g.170368 Transcript_52460/m.170368 type:complete len:263 (-) Transcript_52460:228-1016(-)
MRLERLARQLVSKESHPRVHDRSGEAGSKNRLLNRRCNPALGITKEPPFRGSFAHLLQLHLPPPRLPARHRHQGPLDGLLVLHKGRRQDGHQLVQSSQNYFWDGAVDEARACSRMRTLRVEQHPHLAKTADDVGLLDVLHHRHGLPVLRRGAERAQHLEHRAVASSPGGDPRRGADVILLRGICACVRQQLHGVGLAIPRGHKEGCVAKRVHRVQLHALSYQFLDGFHVTSGGGILQGQHHAPCPEVLHSYRLNLCGGICSR